MDVERPPLPPFTSAEDAARKVRLAEDGWNSRDPVRVALAYTADSRWRNRAEFIHGRAEIAAFLTRKWNRELDYRPADRRGRPQIPLAARPPPRRAPRPSDLGF